MSETKEKGIVDTYLDRRYINKQSKINNKTALRLFLESVYPKETWTYSVDKTKENINEGYEKYLSEDRNYLDDAIDCIQWMTKQKYAPMTINNIIVAIRLFLRGQGLKAETDRDDWKDALRSLLPLNKSITDDRILENIQLRDIINNMGASGRPLALLILSTGLRIGACLDLKVSDLYLEHDPPYVNLRRLSGIYARDRKKMVPPVACMTYECADEIKRWLIIKQTRLKGGFAKENKRFPEDMVFGYSKGNFHGIWQRVLKKMGLAQRDPSTRKRIYHSYTLRKFFSTRMLEDHVPNDLVDAWLGHAKYLATYDKRGEQWIKDQYKEHMHAVTVRGGSGDGSIEQINKFKKEIIEAQELAKKQELDLSIINSFLDLEGITKGLPLNERFIEYIKERGSIKK